MKYSKKLTSLFTILAMLFCIVLPVSVFAEGTGTETDPFIGSGALGNAYNGSVTIHKFNITEWERYINDEGRPGGAEDGYRITYTGLRAAGTELQPASQIGYYYLTQAAEAGAQEADRQPVFLSDMTALSNIIFRLQSATPKTGKNGSDDWQDYDIAGSVDSYGKTASGVMTWTGVPKGYYILTEQANDGIATVLPPFVISMPMYKDGAAIPNPDTPDPTAEIKDIHIYPKNYTKGPGIEKDIQTADDVNGNKISWQIRVNIPVDIAKAQSLVIHDKLSAGLDFDENSLKLTIGGESPEVLLTKTTHYTVSVTLPDPDALPPVTHTAIKVELTPAGLAFLGSYEGKKLHLDYDTTVNLTADQFENLDKVENEAQLDFKNEDGSTSSTNPPGVTVDDYAGLTITKTDGVSGDRLAGAVFAVFTELDGGTNTPKTPLLDKVGNAVQITTGANGIAGYYGLGAGTYYLTEVTAPTGYKPLTGYVKITITAAQVTSQELVNVTVENLLDNTITLPTTGGSGTFWFTIAGAGLIIISGGIYLIYRRRKKS